MGFEIEKIEHEADDIVLSLDSAEALRIMRQIAPRGDVGRVDDALLAVYLEMSFVRLPQLPTAEAMKLFKEHVLFGLSMEEFDLGSRVYDRLAITFEEEDRVAFVREMLRSVEGGTERLGSGLIVLDKPIAATVENWIKEYRAGLSSSKNRTGFDEVTFLNKNPNVQRLSEQQRALLLRLISFYDGFSNIVREYDAQPELYLEDHPELELALINPSPDEWDALKVERMPGTLPPLTSSDVEDADESDDGGDEFEAESVEADEVVAAGGEPVSAREDSVLVTEPVMSTFEEAPAPVTPNVQGVLVQVPLGASDRTGLEVMQEHDALHVAADEPSLSRKKEQSATAQVQMAKTEGGAKAGAGTTSLETIKMQAQAKQTQMQAEIEQKLAQLKRKT